MEERKSVLSPEKHIVTVDQWVVGMLRKPNSQYPHHIFLVIEGANSFGQVIFRRYDLCEGNDQEPNTQKTYARIDIRPERFCLIQEARETLEELVRAEEYYVKAWHIEASKARQLHSNIQATQKNPPIYLLSGDASSFACNHQSQKIEGHNCYTWARFELKKVGLTDIPKSPLDKLIAVPDFVIKPEKPPVETETNCLLM